MPKTSWPVWSKLNQNLKRLSESPVYRTKFIRHASAFILIAAVAAVGGIWAAGKFREEGDASSNSPISSPFATASTTPSFIDLQSVVDDWVTSLDQGITASVSIIDLDHEQLAASLNAETPSYVASIYKLPLAYAGYQLLESNPEEVANKSYATTDYHAGTHSFSECLDLVVRESYNGCAEPLRSDADLSTAVDNLLDSLPLIDVTESGLYATASDLTTILQHIYQHAEIPSESYASLLDSMLDQPPVTVEAFTTYDFRQGLPAGFSESTLVYDKVGWEYRSGAWQTYADAALVFFPALNRHYAVAVITSGIPTETPTPIIELGKMLERGITQ